MSPVFLMSVIYFPMCPALDTAHDIGFSFSKYFQISGVMCVGKDIFPTDNPLHLFVGGSLLPTPLPLPMPVLLFFSSCMGGSEMRLKFVLCGLQCTLI